MLWVLQAFNFLHGCLMHLDEGSEVVCRKVQRGERSTVDMFANRVTSLPLAGLVTVPIWSKLPDRLVHAIGASPVQKGGLWRLC